jgi:membrane protein implicated in regulation of membrane protease activity
MSMLFMICAVVGGTILVCQFLLTVIGLGEHGLEAGHDLAHDFSGVAGDAGHDGGIDHGADGHDSAQHHSTAWLFAVISFRTLVAAVTFFGLVGLAARSMGQGTGIQLLLAVAAGLGAMYGVHWLIRMIGRLGEDATLRVRHALGQEGTVYVPIAGGRSQAGKIQLKLQNRLLEYEAVTSKPDRLATGTKVKVVAIAGNVLEVEPV